MRSGMGRKRFGFDDPAPVEAPLRRSQHQHPLDASQLSEPTLRHIRADVLSDHRDLNFCIAVGASDCWQYARRLHIPRHEPWLLR